MYVVSQDKEQLVNLDSVIRVEVENECIVAWPSNNRGYAFGYTLGNYKTEERAKVVFRMIADCISVGENIMYLPEE